MQKCVAKTMSSEAIFVKLTIARKRFRAFSSAVGPQSPSGHWDHMAACESSSRLEEVRQSGDSTGVRRYSTCLEEVRQSGDSTGVRRYSTCLEEVCQSGDSSGVCGDSPRLEEVRQSGDSTGVRRYSTCLEEVRQSGDSSGVRGDLPRFLAGNGPVACESRSRVRKDHQNPSQNAHSAFATIKQERRLWKEAPSSIAFWFLILWGALLWYTPPQRRQHFRRRRKLHRPERVQRLLLGAKRQVGAEINHLAEDHHRQKSLHVLSRQADKEVCQSGNPKTTTDNMSAEKRRRRLGRPKRRIWNFQPGDEESKQLLDALYQVEAENNGDLTDVSHKRDSFRSKISVHQPGHDDQPLFGAQYQTGVGNNNTADEHRKRRKFKSRIPIRVSNHDNRRLLEAQTQVEAKADDDRAIDCMDKNIDLLNENLKVVGTENLLSLSIMTSLEAMTIYGYIVSTRKVSSIGAVALQIAQLTLRLVHVKYPCFVSKHLMELSRERLKRFAHSSPTEPTSFVFNVQALANSWREITKALATFKCEHPDVNIGIITYEDIHKDIYNEGIERRLIRNFYSEIKQLQSEGLEVGKRLRIRYSTNVIDVAPLVEIVNYLRFIKDIDKAESSEKIKKMRDNNNPLIGAVWQMNLSTPSPPSKVRTTGIDASLTAGSHVFSNTQFAQGTTDLNNVAFALNNIAQTGAPFDIRDSCKNIYQMEANYIVSGVQAVGTEVFRLSLDPETRPSLHRQYIKMHEDHIPSVDFGIYIGGASGAIGTLKIGFVKDISKASFSLADIQQIASQDIGLGQTSTVNFILRDIRRSGLYRKVVGDPEPYPGIVALVSNPITNVQRDSSVQYPIQIYSKLSLEYQLATPTAISNAPTNPTEIVLSNYLESADFDIAVNSTYVTTSPSETVDFDDCGWNTGKFAPVFSAKNIYAYGTYHYSNNMLSVYSVLDQELGDEVNRDYGMPTATIVKSIGFGFGTLPKRDSLLVGNNTDVEDTPGFTVWKIQEFKLNIGDLRYTCNKILISDFGCVIVADGLDINQNDDGTAVFIKQTTFSDPPRILSPYIETPYVEDPNCGIAWSQNQASDVPYYAIGGASTQFDGIDCQWGYVTRRHGISPTPGFVTTPSTETFSAEFGQFYQWTFVGTQNNASTSSAPTQIQRLFFMRPGSTLNSAMPVNAPQIPGIIKVIKYLNEYLASTKGEYLSMTFGQDELSNDFQLAYRNGMFLVRGATENQIRTSLRTTSVLKEITAINDAESITSFDNDGFSSWVKSSSTNYINRLAKVAIAGSSFQMVGYTTAVSTDGILFSGLASGADNVDDWTNYDLPPPELTRDICCGLVLDSATSDAIISRAVSRDDDSQDCPPQHQTPTSDDDGSQDSSKRSPPTPSDPLDSFIKKHLTLERFSRILEVRMSKSLPYKHQEPKVQEELDLRSPSDKTGPSDKLSPSDNQENHRFSSTLLRKFSSHNVSKWPTGS